MVSNGKHYAFDYNGVRLDPYRIFLVYGIAHPAQQHAIKKLLRAGESVKTLERDIQEVIDTLTRWKQMISEDKPLFLCPKCSELVLEEQLLDGESCPYCKLVL